MTDIPGRRRCAKQILLITECSFDSVSFVTPTIHGTEFIVVCVVLFLSAEVEI